MKFKVTVEDEKGTIWDEISYGGNSTNTIQQMEVDLIYMVRNTENLAGHIIKIEVK